MSLPTITGVPPEIWEQVIQILNQFGVTVWDLAQQGITTWEGAGGLKEYLLNNGWELKEVWDLKYMWFQTGAGDVTQSNALVQYVANKVTVAGTAGAEYVNHFTYGETTLGKLKKGIIFGSIFALLVSTLDPSFITDTLKGRLNAVIDRFADDNDDVPVILDANGKIYYHEDMINALRQELIDAGVYSTGDPEAVTGSYQYSFNGTKWYTISDSDIANLSRVNILSMPLDTFYINNQYWFSNTMVYEMNYSDYPASPPLAQQLMIKYRFETPSQRFYRASIAGIGDDMTHLTRPYVWKDSNGSRSSEYTSDWKTVYIKRISDNVIKSARVTNSMTYMNGITGISDPLDAHAGEFPLIDGTNAINEYALYAQLLFGESGQAVEGITVSDDLLSRGIGNAQTALEDIFPSYATDKVTTINPSDEDITATDNWYPISTSDSDVWTDGITEQQSETATDGEVTPDIQAQIADAIKQILEDYYRDPDDPSIIDYPEIPVGDSGDTPPANPELLSGSSNGLWAIYNPSKPEVQQFGAWLWSSNILDQITRMFNSPIDAVIGFHMIYCTPITGASKTIKAGYLDSPVSAPEVTNQYKDIDCGTIAIPEYYRNALDYDNTRISLFLPFIGIVPLDTAQVMGSSLSILYRIDVLTGTCLAQVSVIKEGSNAVMYTYQGNCSVQIPLTATTYTGMVGALLSGISAGASIMTGNIMGAVSAGLEGAMRAGTGLTGVRQSGTIGANAGALGIRIPYVIITHPVSVMPDNFNTLEGLPSAELVPLSSVSGFTRVTYVHLENIPATSQEIEEITGLLQSGVIF